MRYRDKRHALWRIQEGETVMPLNFQTGPHNPPKNRIKYFIASVQILIELCKHGTDGVSVVQNKLPADAEFDSIGFDHFGRLNIVVRSNTFEEVNMDGGEIPMLPTPLFEKRGKL